MHLTDELIRKRYRAMISDIDSMVPEERKKTLDHASEFLRALWVLQSTAGKMPAAKAMSLYMIRQEVAKEVLAEFGSANAADGSGEGKSRRDKYKTLEAWSSENVGAKITPRELAEIGDISYPTALKYIGDRPDVFWKTGHGVYEVRDPAADRKKDKS